VVELAKNLSSGQVVGTITSDDFAVPTTVAGFGSSLYVPSGFEGLLLMTSARVRAVSIASISSTSGK